MLKERKINKCAVAYINGNLGFSPQHTAALVSGAFFVNYSFALRRDSLSRFHFIA
jgi:hypothetical protein